jgi:hypothetical protein
MTAMSFVPAVPSSPLAIFGKCDKTSAIMKNDRGNVTGSSDTTQETAISGLKDAA